MARWKRLNFCLTIRFYLALATHIQDWRSRAQNLRLSQVLDMYFSQRGIFGMTSEDNAIRACNRRTLFTSVAPMETLREQSFAFTTVLDGEMQTQVTLTPNSTQRISTQASEALQSYISELITTEERKNYIFLSETARLYDNTFFFNTSPPSFYCAANTLNDLTCAATATVENDETIWRAASDIYIFIDTTWALSQIRTMIG